MTKAPFIFFVCWYFLSSTLALGQILDTQEASANIIVRGDGLNETQSVDIYASDTIEREVIISVPSGRIEEVLSSVAGFQQFRRSDSRSSNPSAQGVTLRALGGNATSRALVTLDGVPLADPFFGYIPLSAIDPNQLSSVRVTRGGGSGPFGAGALAGTIELKSADVSALGPFGGSLIANDRGDTEGSFYLAEEIGAGFGVINGRWDRGQGFFTTPEGQRVSATSRASFDSWAVGIRGAIGAAPGIELQVSGRAFRDERTLRFIDADSVSEGQDISLRLVGRGDWQFDLLSYLQTRNFSNVIISSTRFVQVLDQRNTPSTGFGGKLEIRPPMVQNQNLRLGIDYRFSDGELQEEAYSAFTGSLREKRRAGGRNSNFGIFADADWRIGAVTINGGLRTDYTKITSGFYRALSSDNILIREDVAEDRSNWKLSWRSGISYAANSALRFRAAAYTGMRLPTLNELYRPFVIFPVVTQANSELKNESLRGFEMGVDFKASPILDVSFTAYDNRVKNAIANVTIGENLRQRQNLPAIDARGGELMVKAAINRLSVHGSISYTDAKVDGRDASLILDGNRPPQTPRWAASGQVTWSPYDRLRLALLLRHIGDQFEDDQENDRLGSATTFGLSADFQVLDNLKFIIRAENVFQEKVVTRFSRGAIDLGNPRTVWVGFRFGF
jgi:outer membrane receptor protein involved in Fe transport